jgi:adenine-specific DNA-methyltransferase
MKEETMRNLLIKGDNIQGLNYLLHNLKMKGKIDLIYIDPPFATGGNFIITDGRASTISNSRNGTLAYSDRVVGKDFIEFLRARISLLKELMSEQGSIYVHTDYKIGHYVKVMMDDVFGIENFRNDITRIKCNPKNFDRIGYGNIKDLILFYTKSSNPIWNEPREKYTEKDLEKLFPKMDKQGRRYTTVPIHAPGETVNGKSNLPFKGIKPPVGRHWRTGVETLTKWDNEGLIEWSSTGNPRKIIYANERKGKRVQDIWEFKDPQYPGYPTEKKIELLDLIIRTSSNPESIVLDCFCGSGTALKSAHINGRKWIGIDQSDHAIKATIAKLESIKADLYIRKPEYDFIDLELVSNHENAFQPVLKCGSASLLKSNVRNKEVNTMVKNEGITITFLSDERLPTRGDHFDYKLHYSYVNTDFLGKPQEESQTQSGYIIINISGTLLACWGLNEDELHKVLYKYGNRHIGDLISKGAPIDRVELGLDSYNSPPQCPFDPNEINIIFNKPIIF